jgi:hypothetical protein
MMSLQLGTKSNNKMKKKIHNIFKEIILSWSKPVCDGQCPFDSAKFGGPF